MEVAALSLAVAGATLTLGKVVVQLKDFISGVKEVDENVVSFISELETLQTVLTAVKDSLVEVGPVVGQSDSLDHLLKCIDKTVSDCQHTVGKLDLIFRRMSKKKSGGIYQAIVKQLKMTFAAENISSLRRQVLSYNITFQTSLSTITLCVILHNQSHHSNHDVAEALSPRLDELTKHLERLELQQKSVVIPRTADDGEGDDDDEQQIAEDIEDLRQSAQVLFNSASTVIGQWSTTGSEYGVPLSAKRQQNLRDWIEEISSDGSAVPAGGTVLSIISDKDDSAATSVPDTNQSHNVILDEQMDVRSNLIHQGRTYYERGDYGRSLTCFRQAKAIGSIEHGAREDDMLDETLHLWLCLSTIRYGTVETGPKKFALVEEGEVLLDFANSVGQTTQQTLPQQRQTISLLAQANFYFGNVVMAEELCMKVLKLSTGVGAKEEEAYEDSMLLMVEIMYENGNTESAGWWRRWVGKTISDKSDKFFKDTEWSTRRRQSYEELAPRIFFAMQRKAFGPILELLCPELAAERDPEHLKLMKDFLGDTEKGYYWVLEAIKANSIAMLSLFIEKGANVESGPVVHKGQIETYTQNPLGLAIERNNLEAARRLVQHGADINAIYGIPGKSRIFSRSYFNKHFCSMLGLAIFYRFEAMTLFLLKNGADVNQARSTEPAIFIALTTRPGRRLVPVLLEFGADANAKMYSITPLTAAIIFMPQGPPNHAAIELVPRQADPIKPSSPEYEDETIMVVMKLIAAGAEVHTESHSGSSRISGSNSPHRYAEVYKLKRVQKLLYEAGVNKPRWWKRF